MYVVISIIVIMNKLVNYIYASEIIYTVRIVCIPEKYLYLTVCYLTLPLHCLRRGQFTAVSLQMSYGNGTFITKTYARL